MIQNLKVRARSKRCIVRGWEVNWSSIPTTATESDKQNKVKDMLKNIETWLHSLLHLWSDNSLPGLKMSSNWKFIGRIMQRWLKKKTLFLHWEIYRNAKWKSQLTKTFHSTRWIPGRKITKIKFGFRELSFLFNF